MAISGFGTLIQYWCGKCRKATSLEVFKKDYKCPICKSKTVVNPNWDSVQHAQSLSERFWGKIVSKFTNRNRSKRCSCKSNKKK